MAAAAAQPAGLGLWKLRIQLLERDAGQLLKPVDNRRLLFKPGFRFDVRADSVTQLNGHKLTHRRRVLPQGGVSLRNVVKRQRFVNRDLLNRIAGRRVQADQDFLC
jgi:hypothetical protein